MVTAPTEQDIREVGIALAKAFPSGRAHPFKALDDKAMDLASQDASSRRRSSASSTSCPPAGRSTTWPATSAAS